MYITTRFYYPHGIEGEEMKTTVKEFDTIEKAIKYAHRYNSGVRFAGIQIEDENGKLVYEITSGNDTYDYREEEKQETDIKENELKEDNSIKTILNKIDAGIITYPKLRKNRGYDDGSVYLYLLDENKQSTDYRGLFSSLRKGIEELGKLNLKGRYYVWTDWQANTRNQWYIEIDF
jgi:septation ring formation regulator EzrA